MKIIEFNAGKCMHCYKCVRNCDVKAIMIKDGGAQIIEESCILCGHCLHVCPQSAKTMKSDLDTVKYYIKRGEKTILSLAPSYAGFFRDTGFSELRDSLLRSGFFDVRETAEGAAAVTAEYAGLLKEGRMDNIITTCCPSVNDLIEIYYPALVPFLAPVVSPMAAHGKMLKKEYGADAKVVFAGPCIAKKKEAADLRNGKSIDAVLTFNDILCLLKEETASSSAPPLSGAKPISTELNPGVNRLYPATSGVITSVISTLSGQSARDHYRKFHIHGTGNCIELCESMIAGELHSSFIEMNMCTGGCLSGSAPLERSVSRFRTRIDLEETITREAADASALGRLEAGIDLSKVYTDHSVPEPNPSEQQVREILAKTGKTGPEDELNCGACGYFTCREKAIAVFQKKAELNMCIPYMHDKAESLANLVMETSPNLILIVDKDMKILEYSAVGEKYFGKTREDAMQMYLFEFIDSADFEWVYKTHQSIRGKRVRYQDYGLSALLNIVYVEKKDMVLATFIDIAEQEKQSKKYYDKKLNTIELAQTVIKKQMTVAQEIAGLLGESAAETKTTLLNLCDSLLEDGDED